MIGYEMIYSTAQLTLEPRDSILDARNIRVSSLESRVSSLKVREIRLSQICKNSEGFRGNDLFLEGRIIHCTILLTPKCLDRYRMKTFNHTIAD